jgi:hypothetical protein
METLTENIKNLGARIKQIDKKIEKRIKDMTSTQLREQLTQEAFDNPLFDFRKSFCAALNLKLLHNGAYLNLPNEDWAVKIMTNLLTNQGVYDSLDAKKREDLVQGQAAYALHSLASKIGNSECPEAQQVRQEAERHIQIINSIIGEGESASSQQAEEAQE